MSGFSVFLAYKKWHLKLIYEFLWTQETLFEKKNSKDFWKTKQVLYVKYVLGNTNKIFKSLQIGKV